MSATTKLQFTLSSGSDPVPTPPDDTVIVPSSPNTGDNITTDNGSATVFTALFAVIGLAALIIFLAKYLKKNRHISFAERGAFHISARPRVFATVALTLAVASLGGIAITNMYNNAKNTEAASQRELDVKVKSNITFNVDRGQSKIEPDIIEVVNNGAKYDLYVSTTNNKFALNSSTYLSPVSAPITSPSARIDADQWGMTTQNVTNPDITAPIWAASPTTETKIQSDITASTTPVTYGVNLGNDLPDGTYSTEVTYRAVAKNYKVTVKNGFVNKEGDKTEDWFDSGVDVAIRESCTASRKTFSYWYIHEGLSSASVISKVQNFYMFTMPANDVYVEAVCEGDPEPGSKWEIHYDKNAAAASGNMSAQVVTSEPTTLTANSYTYTGYTFQGWACNKTATTADFTDKQGNITQSTLEGKGCTKTIGGDVSNDYYTLYAIWKKQEDIWIQDVTPEMCDDMQLFEVRTLPDRRDRKNYSFTKYADGRCWMIQDLDYRPTGSTVLTVADTDVSAQRTVTFGTSGSVDGLYKTQDGYSTLYDYNAATGGYWKNATKTKDKVVPDSLCPASWKIPDASHSSADASYGSNAGEFYRLWNYNVGRTNGYGTSASNDWKRNFIFGESVTISSGSVQAPHFTYNGSYNFPSNKWANKSDSARDAEPGNYASYFLNTTSTNNSNVVWPAAFNPHKPGVASDTTDINVTDPTHGSAVRCVLRTASERANREKSTSTGDYTELSPENQARVNQDN